MIFLFFSWGFNPVYDVIYSFDSDDVCIKCYTDAPSIDQQQIEKEPPFFAEERQLLQSTELCIPSEFNERFSDIQMAVYMLTTVYGLSLSALAAIPQVHQSEEIKNDLKASTTNANVAGTSAQHCSVVNRFVCLGSGWGFSVHCLEAIQFKVRSIFLLFYVVKTSELMLIIFSQFPFLGQQRHLSSWLWRLWRSRREQCQTQAL